MRRNPRGGFGLVVIVLSLLVSQSAWGKGKTCPAGKVASEDTRGNCCWPGQAWLKSARRCVGSPKCPAGMSVKGEDCAGRPTGKVAGNAKPASAPAGGVGCPAGMTVIAGGSYVAADGATVSVSELCMDRTEVTVAAYQDCVTGGQCTEADSGGACNGGSAFWRTHPANCVDRAQASRYCKSLGKRLPSEDEWEWAARSRDRAFAYPWGDQIPDGGVAPGTVCSRLVTCNFSNGPRDEHVRTCAVGTHAAGASVDGIQDLAGNVAEWIAAVDKTGPGVVRGGSYFSQRPVQLDSANRGEVPPETRRSYIGFRCVKSP